MGVGKGMEFELIKKKFEVQGSLSEKNRIEEQLKWNR